MPAKKTKPALIVFLEDTNRAIIHSRLTDDLSTQEKNRLYTAFLGDTIYTCLTLPNTSVKINYPSDDARKIVMHSINTLKERLTSKQIHSLESDEVNVLLNRGKNHGERLRNAFKEAFDDGCSPVVLIGCVTPTLSKKAIQDAYKRLRNSDIVFGPTLEGSYYLVGMNQMVDKVFEEVNWNGGQPVYSQMVSIADNRTLKWHEMELWYDLRQPEDFEFLIRDINFFRQIGDEKSASCTEDILDEILKKMA